MSQCEQCGNPYATSMVIHGTQLWCRPCHQATKGSAFGESANVIQDSIEGGIEIKHGICHENGDPKRYYSRSEIKKAAYEAGVFNIGDTPKVNSRLREEAHVRREAESRK